MKIEIIKHALGGKGCGHSIHTCSAFGTDCQILPTIKDNFNAYGLKLRFIATEINGCNKTLERGYAAEHHQQTTRPQGAGGYGQKNEATLAWPEL